MRDFLDVKDAVRALWLLAGKGEPGGTYNVCSETGTKVGSVLEIFLTMASRPIPACGRQAGGTRPRPIPARGQAVCCGGQLSAAVAGVGTAGDSGIVRADALPLDDPVVLG